MSEKQFKIVTIGDSGVGKTSIVNMFYNKIFPDKTSPTVGASYMNCRVHVPGYGETTLNIWDTAGQEKFQSLIPLYIRNASAVLYVFDVSQVPSIEALEEQLREYEVSIDAKAIMVLCANKVDIVHDRVVCEMYKEWAESREFRFFATSAMTGEGIDDMFNTLAQTLVQDTLKVESGESIVGYHNDERKRCCK